ncbi:hypothetical protein B0A52_05127 [Exophiala mesophila]|uniref:Zn(2)-C6 fungal-type domain-containing protein n=1 Tax=Exophiala mesophila TaxID=212818 RepID=A0A438N705_EXOME|nr:hypothetical protein B0A52_05127 [Exophiala mesophila]
MCNNCERRQIFCDFSTTPGPDASPSTGADSKPPLLCVGSDRDSNKSPTQKLVDPFASPDLVSRKTSTDLDVTDLRLIHHFTSVVALDLASGDTPEAIALWQVHAVKLGFKHHFLLRGILAASAFHLGYLYPERRAEYVLIGSAHQSIALEEFQATLVHVSESNCHALFAFSCLIIVLAFASSSKDKARDLNTDVLSWFYLLRGAHIVLNMHGETIRCSFLKPLLDELAHVENTEAHKYPYTEEFTKLFRICNSTDHDKESAQAYDLAIHALLSAFIQVSLLRERGQGTVLASFVWPLGLSPKFLELLGEKQPEAVIILAHYCVLIYWSEEQNGQATWFIDGWANYMLETIEETVSGEWLKHLQWPHAMIKSGKPM